jgi:hypothetical protein
MKEFVPKLTTRALKPELNLSGCQQYIVDSTYRCKKVNKKALDLLEIAYFSRIILTFDGQN